MASKMNEAGSPMQVRMRPRFSSIHRMNLFFSAEFSIDSSFPGTCFSVRAGKECHSLVRLGGTTLTESEISGPKVKPSYLCFGFNFNFLRESKKMLNVNNSCSNDPSQTKLIFSQPKNGRVSKICTYLVCEL